MRRAQAEAFGVPDRDRLLQLGPGDAGCRRGQVALALVDLPSTLPHIKSGKLKALAVTGATRSAFLPEVPTFAQAGVPSYESTGWFGVVAPDHRAARFTLQYWI